jgi:lipopolysaccharide export system protein LptA
MRLGDTHTRSNLAPMLAPMCMAVCMAVFMFGALFMGASSTAYAQSLNFGGTGGDLPIDVYAENGIEWQQENSLFIARGDARAVRGQVEVLSDELRAYYREGTTGQSEIWRLDAVGNVRIVSNTETAYGNRAIYNADQQVLVIDGEKPRLESGQDILTATQQLEYWEAKKFAVARGNAVATREDKQVRADVLVAHFNQDARGKSQVYRIDAYDNVRVKTEAETAVGDRGVYNVNTGVAVLTGNVTMVRDTNTLNGCRAEVNLNTGISKLFACPNQQGSNRVRGTFIPKQRDTN